MQFQRSAGILLHVTSLPGPFGIGDLGSEAFRFLDFLAASGQSYWQILPLGPTADDGSPYAAQSSWAGSSLLISLDMLGQEGDLTETELDAARVFSSGWVDYSRVTRVRQELLPRAAERFMARRVASKENFETFCEKERNWLEDWSLFAAVKKQQAGQPWWTWPRTISLRSATGVKEYRRKLKKEILVEKYIQFRFFEQWAKLKQKAEDCKVRIIGDIPIYCARDSADVWASRALFQLAANGSPRVVSGVPPDYFAQDGQLWGTPVFDWKKNKLEGYSWWIRRLRAALRLTDVVRIDHFRAFDAYWEIPIKASTAKEGAWVQGPGNDFFESVRKALGAAPFIAEDLGVITKSVRDLRDRWELPGMKVLQFAFGEGAASPHLPIRHVRNSVAYTGTHDNDTTVGWYEKASESEKDLFRRYTSTDGHFSHYHMIRLAFSSVADLAIVPIQDVLALGSWARMNTPGVAHGNWRFKLVPEQLNEGTIRMLGELTGLFGRLPGQREAVDDDEEAAAA